MKTISKEATLFFHLIIKNSPKTQEMLQQIEIKNQKIAINLGKCMLYSIIINENTDLEFKIFACSFIFKNAKKRIFGISAYFNRINYYYCIANEFNFNSVEIIFVDFSKSNLYLKNISISYDNQDFLVKEEFNDIKSRKRISFINIEYKN